MKAQIAAKYLQFLNRKNANKNSGFTLIELLVVIIIIGILSAIALPSFLNQAAKARGTEAKANVGAMNRSQQAFFLEQQTFTANPANLGLSLKLTTENYAYSSAENGDLKTGVTNFGTSRQADIKSYNGGTFYQVGTTTTVLCEAKTAGETPLEEPNAPTAEVVEEANVTPPPASEASCDDTALEIN